MTISNQNTSIVVSGDGATRQFFYNFQVDTKDQATLTFVSASGAEMEVPRSSWGFSGAGNASGGTFTYPVSAGVALQTGERLVFERTAPYVQPTSLRSQGPYIPGTVEAMVDFVVKQTQQLYALYGHAVRVPTSQGKAPTLPPVAVRAGKLAAWDAAGNFIPAEPGDMSSIGTTSALGGVSRLLADRAADFVFAEDFGVRGDNITDNTVTLANALGRGRSVYFRPGRYRSGPVSLNFQGQHLIGAGMSATVLVARDNAPFITLNGYVGHEGKGITDMTVDCSVHAAVMTNYGIGILGSGRSKIDHVSVIGAGTGFFIDTCNLTTLNVALVVDAKKCCYDVYGGAYNPALPPDQQPRTDLVYFTHSIGTCALQPNRTITPGTVGLRCMGMMNSMTFTGFAVLSVDRGMVFDASDDDFARGRIPALIYGQDVGVDFSLNENFYFNRASDVILNTVYTNNARNANGVVINPDCHGFKIEGLRGGGHGQAGLIISGRDIKISSAAMSFSSQGTESEGYGTKLFKYSAVVINATARNVTITGSQLGGRDGIGATCRHVIYIQTGARNILISDNDLNGAGCEAIRNLAAEGEVTIGPNRGVPYTAINGIMMTDRQGLFAYGEAVIANGQIVGVAILSGGAFYKATNAPRVAFLSQPINGTGAAGTVLINDAGQVAGVTMTNGGQGYSDPFTVAVAFDAPPIQPYIAPYSRTGAGTDMTLRAAGGFAVLLGNGMGDVLRGVTQHLGGNHLGIDITNDGKVRVFPDGDAQDINLELRPKGGNSTLLLGGPIVNSGPNTPTRALKITLEDGSVGFIPISSP